MSVLPLLVFVSLMLVALAVLALAYSLKQSDHEHEEHLSLLPLEDDTAPAKAHPVVPGETHPTKEQ